MATGKTEQHDPISELLMTPIPEKLWHYTSFQGLHGIVTSKTIFATDLRFLNDREEFVHAQRIASEVVAGAQEFGANQFPAKWCMENAVNLAFKTGPLKPERLQVFVASFSAAEDQLSQWRGGYSRGSSGVSLAFDLKNLRPPSGVDTFVLFAPCVYDLQIQRKLIRYALDNFIGEMQAYWNGAHQAFQHLKQQSSDKGLSFIDILQNDQGDLSNRLLAASAVTTANLLEITGLLKNPSFHEEQEWRLVLPLFTSKTNLQNPPRFRVAKTTLIPYIAYPFSLDAATVPLVDVIVGPDSDVNAGSAIHQFLRSEGLRIIPRYSTVPFRSV